MTLFLFFSFPPERNFDRIISICNPSIMCYLFVVALVGQIFVNQGIEIGGLFDVFFEILFKGVRRDACAAITIATTRTLALRVLCRILAV